MVDSLVDSRHTESRWHCISRFQRDARVQSNRDHGASNCVLCCHASAGLPPPVRALQPNAPVALLAAGGSLRPFQ